MTWPTINSCTLILMPHYGQIFNVLVAHFYNLRTYQSQEYKPTWGHGLEFAMSKYARKPNPQNLITLLNNMGPQSMTVGCLEFNPNLSLLEHPTAMFQGPEKTRVVRCIMLCWGSHNKWTLFITSQKKNWKKESNKVIREVPRNLGLLFGTAIAAFPKHSKSSMPSQSPGWPETWHSPSKVAWNWVDLLEPRWPSLHVSQPKMHCSELLVSLWACP